MTPLLMHYAATLVDLRETYVYKVESLEHMVKIMRNVEFIVLDERQCDLFNKCCKKSRASKRQYSKHYQRTGDCKGAIG